MTSRVTVASVTGLLVLSSLLVPGAVSAQQSGQVVGQPDLEFTTATGEFAPGTAGELTLSVTNRGQINRGGPSQYENRVTTARGVTVDIQDDSGPINIETGQISLGNVPTGSAEAGPIPITVSENAEPGTYRIPVEYEYQYTRIADYDSVGVEYSDFTRSESGSITIEVKNKPLFEIVSRDSNAQVGDTGDVTVTLQNTGSEVANDASITATSQSPSMTFDSGAESSSASVGTWEPGENKTINYSVSHAADAPDRTYSANVVVDYTDTDGLSQTSRQFTLGIPTAPEQSFAVDNITSDLRVSEDGYISGTVTNTGPETANNVVVRYADNDSNIIPIERSAAVGTLEAGESASFRLPIEVNSEAREGSKSLSFNVRYRNTDGDQRRYTKLDVRADIAPERDQFLVDVQEETVEAGGDRTITVEVTNNLNQTVTDVEARLFADDPLDAGDNSEGFVQSMEPNETVTLTFELSAAASATPQKTYPISFDFRYDDERGNSQLSNTIRVPIDVTSSSDDGLPLSVIAFVGIAIIGIAGIVLYRRD